MLTREQLENLTTARVAVVVVSVMDNNMNIYLVTNNSRHNRGYDTFQGMVIIAESEETARNIPPFAYSGLNEDVFRWNDNDRCWQNRSGDWDNWHSNGDRWPAPYELTVELIGTSISDEQRILTVYYHNG